jgi:drug/metabolite transporter (DMT)-like permease
MLAGGVLLLIGSWVAGEQPTLPPDARALACWAYLVVAGSLLGFSAYMVLLQRTSAALASSYSFVNPVIGLLLGVAIGGEVVSASEALAAGVIAGGVILLLVANATASARPPNGSR